MNAKTKLEKLRQKYSYLTYDHERRFSYTNVHLSVYGIESQAIKSSKYKLIKPIFSNQRIHTRRER